MEDSIDERYIEAFLAIYECLNRNIDKVRELRYQILRDNKILDDNLINKEKIE